MQPISFIINTGKDTLEYMKLLLTSLKMNLDYDGHEILIFVDSDNENSLEYFKSQKSEFKDLKIITHQLPFPVGYQRNKTILTEYAKYDIVSYLQSDMVVGTHYDTNIMKHVQRGRILSSTRVEPPLHPPSDKTFTENFGIVPSEFDISKWNSYSDRIKSDRMGDYFFAPITYYKEDWMALGGYDTQFRRSREDSDLVQRCLHVGIELKQTWSANVYHFTCVSSRGTGWFDNSNEEAQLKVKLQNEADYYELKKFIRKWGAVNHGESKLLKLDMDLMISNCGLDDLITLEPFFSRVWINDVRLKDSAIQKLKNEVDLANKLLGANVSDWVKFKHLFNSTDFNNIFHMGMPDEYGILVEIDFSKVTVGNRFLTNLQNLYNMLHSADIGTYELDGILIHIKSIKTMEVDIKANNPKFDYSLLKIV